MYIPNISELYSIPCMNALLDLSNGLAGIQALGAHPCAVHDCLTPVQLILVIQLLDTFLREVISAVDDPPSTVGRMVSIEMLKVAFRMCQQEPQQRGTDTCNHAGA